MASYLCRAFAQTAATSEVGEISKFGAGKK
jgi:hypothetical protein